MSSVAEGLGSSARLLALLVLALAVSAFSNSLGYESGRFKAVEGVNQRLEGMMQSLSTAPQPPAEDGEPPPRPGLPS